MRPRSQHPVRDVIAIVAVAAVALAVRLLLLNHQSLWHDEGFSLLLSDGSLIENLTRLLAREAGDRYQIGYFLFLGLWRDVFGSSEVALRLPSALMGAATAGVIYATGLGLYGRRHALWSAVLAVVSAFGIYFSQDARPYAAVILISAIQLWLVSDLITRGSKRSTRWTLALVTGAGLFVSIFVGFMAVALLIAQFATVHPDERRRWISCWWPAAVASIPAMGFFLLSPAVTSPSTTLVTRGVQTLMQNAAYAPFGTLVGLSYGPPQEDLQGISTDRIDVIQGYWVQLALVAVVAVGLVIVIGMALWRDRSAPKARSTQFLAATLVTGYLVALAFAFATGINWVPRHSAFLAAPLWLLLPVAVGRTMSGRVRQRWVATAGSVLVAALVILNVYASVNYFINDDYEKGDYRSAASLVSEPLAKGDPVILVTGTTRLFGYYESSGVIDASDTNPERLIDDIDALSGGSGVIWIVQNRPSWWADWHPGQPRVQDILSTEYFLVDTYSFTYLTVYQFERP